MSLFGDLLSVEDEANLLAILQRRPQTSTLSYQPEMVRMAETEVQEGEKEDRTMPTYHNLPRMTPPSEDEHYKYQTNILFVELAQHLFDEIIKRPFTMETRRKLRDLVLDVSDKLYRVTKYNIKRGDLSMMRNDLVIAKETLIFSLPGIDVTHHLNYIFSMIEQMYDAALLSGVDGFERDHGIMGILKKEIRTGMTSEMNVEPEGRSKRWPGK